MSKKVKLVISIIVLFCALFILSFSYYMYQLGPTAKESEIVKVEIPKGSTGNNVALILENEGLIKSANIFKVYLKIHNIDNIGYGFYDLDKTMGVKHIIEVITGNNALNVDISITFKEGLNMRGIARIIEENTNNSYDEILDLLDNEEYIDTLIDDYWFLTDEIKEKDIYYPLEGYLAPNTYRFLNKDVTIDEIFRKMLDQTGKILDKYKDNIKGYTIHEFLTLASIVQSEGLKKDDMSDVASVFYNRLEDGKAFESCSTACYASKFDGLCVPANVNTKYNSPYNTYLSSMIGLPIGPISNPGEVAIEAALNPSDTDYLYFLSDIDKKTYFFKHYEDHQAKKQELIRAGKWY